MGIWITDILTDYSPIPSVIGCLLLQGDVRHDSCCTESLIGYYLKLADVTERNNASLHFWSSK